MKKILAILMFFVFVFCIPHTVVFGGDMTYDIDVIGGTADKSIAEQGTIVTTTAEPTGEGRVFLGWINLDHPVVFTDAKSPKTTFVMIENPARVEALFADILVEEIPDQVYTGGEIEPIVEVELDGVDIKLILGENYSFTYRNNINAGKAEIVVDLFGYYTGTITVNFNILPASIEDAIVTAEDQEYDGKPKESKLTIEWSGKPVDESDYDVSYTNNIRPGTADVKITGKGNFSDTTSATCQFEIKKRALTITAGSDTKEYDGSPLVCDEFSFTGMADGDRVDSVTTEGSITDVGITDNHISDAVIKNPDGEDVTDCYEITYVSGTLEVTPKEAKIIADDASKVQGDPDPSFTGTVEGLVSDDDLGEIEYLRSDENEKPGKYEKAITAVYTENPNYKVTVVDGNFTIMALYKVVWLDAEGEELDSKPWVEGEEEPVTDKEPLKEADQQYTYTFAGWDEGSWNEDNTVKTYTPEFEAVEIPSEPENVTPKTGEGSSIWLWSTILISSVILLAVIYLKRKSILSE